MVAGSGVAWHPVFQVIIDPPSARVGHKVTLCVAFPVRSQISVTGVPFLRTAAIIAPEIAGERW